MLRVDPQVKEALDRLPDPHRRALIVCLEQGRDLLRDEAMGDGEIADLDASTPELEACYEMLDALTQGR